MAATFHRMYRKKKRFTASSMHLGQWCCEFYPTISLVTRSKTLHRAARRASSGRADSPARDCTSKVLISTKKNGRRTGCRPVKEIDGQEYRELVESTVASAAGTPPDLPGAPEFASYLREKAYWQPYRIPKPNTTASVPPTKPDLPMPPTSTMPCPASTNAASTSTKAPWKAFT